MYSALMAEVHRSDDIFPGFLNLRKTQIKSSRLGEKSQKN